MLNRHVPRPLLKLAQIEALVQFNPPHTLLRENQCIECINLVFFSA